MDTPRVHITYDLEADGATESLELPFVIGVLADLCGNPAEPLPPLPDRKFMRIERASFDAVLAMYAPRLALGNIELRFESLADFEPQGVARQVPGLPEAFAAGKPGASEQLDELLHAPEFQKLEASWRGLDYLLRNTDTSESLQVRVLHASKQDLLADFRHAPGMAARSLFAKVHEECYGVFRGEPFGVLVGDYEFSSEPEDIELLEDIAHVAAAAHAPFLSSASPRMFSWSDFTEVPAAPGLLKAFESSAYTRWQAFRGREESLYAALVLPRMLLRLPYGDQTVPVRAFAYQERIDGHHKLLWGNAAYALAARLAEAFRVYHWCAAISGVEGGGLVEGLPTYARLTESGEVEIKCPTETGITDIAEHELNQLGFTVLLHWKNTNCAAFFRVPSCRGPAAPTLPYIMAVSRFAHYMKAMVRDRGGPPLARADCERLLNAWIGRYVAPETPISMEDAASRPLLEARVEVADVAVAYLRPHFQLADPGAALRVMLALPAPVR